MKTISRRVMHRPPAPRTLVKWDSFYTARTGGEMIGWRSLQTKSDKTDAVWQSRSADHGRTWTAEEPLRVVEERPDGVWRRHPHPGWVDPVNGRLLVMSVEGFLRGDHPVQDGMRSYYLTYQTSRDGGRHWDVEARVIQNGPPGRYTPDRPLDGVTVGRNAAMLGDMGCKPIRLRSGRVLVPIQVCPVGPDGEYINPGGGYTYHEAAVLMGAWRADGGLDWGLSEYVRNDPALSTRGCVEPTLAEAPDGRVLMVLRGSNGGKKDPDCRIPGRRWFTVSTDDGATWGPVEPWTYEDGEPFHSPSSMSLLLTHSRGGIYWIGNLTADNPRANSPRHPLVIGQVDPISLKLIRGSVRVIDTRAPDEPADLILSNFNGYEDRETGEIVVQMSRFFPGEWRGDAFEYRIGLT